MPTPPTWRPLTGRGVPGFLIAGSTGEGPYLEPGERRSLIATRPGGRPRRLSDVRGGAPSRCGAP